MPSTEENIERNLAESLARIRILTAKKVDNQIAKVTADPEKCKIKAKSKLSGKPMVDSLNKIATWLPGGALKLKLYLYLDLSGVKNSYFFTIYFFTMTNCFRKILS